MRAHGLAAVMLVACGDNLPPEPPPAPDCSAFAAPAAGWSTDAAREAYRQAALRQRLRVREAIEPGYVVREAALAADDERVARGAACPQELAEVGRILFEHTFALGTPFQRVQSDDIAPVTTSCVSCHWQRGAGGGGGLPDAAFLQGDGDSTSSADARNPPSLAGAAVVEALAAEMTVELAAQRTALVAQARREGTRVTVDLVAKGIAFGALAADGNGRIDTTDVRGVDPDLVVRPFGWKGSMASLVEAVTAEAAAHLAITNELQAGQRVAIAAYIATLDVPSMRPLEVPVDRDDPLGPVQPYQPEAWARGRTLFDAIGCASCHVPALPLTVPELQLRAAPADVGVAVALPSGPQLLFSDLKRHNLGDDNASQHLQAGVGRRLYLTRPLWGMATSPPYMHDGTAMTVDAAVARHGGEGVSARDAWLALPQADLSAIRIFLASLRRPPRMMIP